MEKADCVCRKQSLFKLIIHYKNESVFKSYEGISIKKCINCGVLKTFPGKRGMVNTQISKTDLYEQNISKYETLFKPIIRKIIQFSKGTHVLDVGCSSGILLTQLTKKSFQVTGIEPNKKAYSLARKKLGVRIFYGTLKQYISGRKKKYYDCIIYNHVLEHIEDINEEIKMIKSLLKKGGLLVIGVPNTDNVFFYLRNKYWESLLPAEHIWHFHSRYLIRLLENKGFTILDVSFENDKRYSYPFMKRVYFKFLSVINNIFSTGEAVLLVSQKN